MSELLGWCATAVFVSSFFARRPGRLRLLQMSGAALWVMYGLLLRAPPVVAANVLVMAAAAWTAWRDRAALPRARRP